MKKFVSSAVLLAFLGTAAHAAATGPETPGAETMKRVDKIRLVRSIDSWRPIDRDTLIVWTSPSRPYLVELSRRSPELRHAMAIGLTSTAGSVYERFDSVVVGGLRYRIEAIYELDPEAARQIKRT